MGDIGVVISGFPLDQGWRRLVIGPADSRKAEWRCVNACAGRGAGAAAAVSEEDLPYNCSARICTQAHAKGSACKGKESHGT